VQVVADDFRQVADAVLAAHDSGALAETAREGPTAFKVGVRRILLWWSRSSGAAMRSHDWARAPTWKRRGLLPGITRPHPAGAVVLAVAVSCARLTGSAHVAEALIQRPVRGPASGVVAGLAEEAG